MSIGVAIHSLMVRRLVLVGSVLCGACYTPRAPSGAPCDPAAASCPADQVCTTEAGGSFCESSPGLSLDAPEAVPVRLTYVATIAVCIDPRIPDPTLCTALNGGAQLAIDARDSTTMDPWQSYLRFDLDGALAGRTVEAVTLRLVATDDDKAPGPDSGEVWKVKQFTEQTLMTQVPPQLGNQPLASSQGAVAALQPVEWSLPAGLVAPDSAVHLGLVTADEDGVAYWNLDGQNPPELVIDAR
jgi:hypothetical protein